MYNVSKHRREKKQVEKDADDKEKTEKTEKEKTNRLFVEEGATKYFRRLDFTPDGAFLITPGLIYKTFLSSIFLPTPQKPDVHVRWVLLGMTMSIFGMFGILGLSVGMATPWAELSLGLRPPRGSVAGSVCWLAAVSGLVSWKMMFSYYK